MTRVVEFDQFASLGRLVNYGQEGEELGGITVYCVLREDHG